MLTWRIIIPLGLLFIDYSLCYDNLSMMMAFRDDMEQMKNNFPQLRKTETMESKVVLYLFTRCSENGEILELNDEVLESSHFSTNKSTKIIIHGYMDNLYKPMPTTIKNNLLLTEDVNVIVVDWGAIATALDYFWVARQTKDVGAYLGKFVDFLVEHGTDPEDIHLIGHSLGAHIAGFAGSSATRGKPGRITGLDPAGPMFHKVPPSGRLSTDDADFVDCIHTCGGLLGLMEPICHADFYANQGSHQPGCIFIDFGRCSHIRSHKYFAESIFPSHKFFAYKCPSYNAKPENCTSTSELMGYYAEPRVRGDYYVKTNKKAPFALNHP